jgi:predicted GNAT family N-acyltransferase
VAVGERRSGAAIELRWTEGEPGLAPALALRERVFCGEQGVSIEEERDGRDAEAMHLLAFEEGGALVGTLRVLRGGEEAKIGRVAVAPAWRRRGVASRMLDAALAHAAREGCTRARLAAQTDAIELYLRAGFAVESERFMEAGIEHVWMGRALDSPGAAERAGG